MHSFISKMKVVCVLAALGLGFVSYAEPELEPSAEGERLLSFLLTLPTTDEKALLEANPEATLATTLKKYRRVVERFLGAFDENENTKKSYAESITDFLKIAAERRESGEALTKEDSIVKTLRRQYLQRLENFLDLAEGLDQGAAGQKLSEKSRMEIEKKIREAKAILEN